MLRLLAFSTLLLGTVNASALSLVELKRAYEQSSGTGKPLLAVVGAEWCGPCKMLDKQLKEDSAWKAAGAKFIYIHIDIDHDKEAWSSFKGKHGAAGNGIPMIYVIKPSGEKAFSQSGYSPKLLDVFKKFGTELATAGKASVGKKELAKVKAATKSAKTLLADGKFVSAYETLAEVAEFFEVENNKSVDLAKELQQEVLTAAKERIDTAAAAVVKPLEPSKFDSAYHLTVIARVFSEHEDVKSAVDAKIKELEKHEYAGPLLKQARLYDEGREAEKAEDTAKAKELYNKLISDFKNSPGARKAQARLDALAG